MKRFGRAPVEVGRAWLILVLLGSAAPLAAQSTPANSSGDEIGPRELRNFSLGAPSAPATSAQPAPLDGLTLAPRSTTPPASIPTAPPASIPTAPRATPQRATQSRTAPAPAPATRTQSTPSTGTTAPGAPAPTRALPPPIRVAPNDGGSVTVALPPADPLSGRATPANESDLPRASSQPVGPTVPATSELPADNAGSLIPWLLGLLVLAGGALLFAFRARLRPTPILEPAIAGPPLVLPRELERRSFPTPPPRPATSPPLVQPHGPAAPAAFPRAPLQGGITVKRPNPFVTNPPPLDPAAAGVAAPARSGGGPRHDPAPAAAPRPATAGIVSTRLRPQLDLEFEPSRAIIDEAQASVLFDVIVVNSGNAPARQVLVEACMINAGPEQDAELRRFFEEPVGQGDRIAAIPPLGRISLKSAVSLPIDQVRVYEVSGRKLFVPLVAFNALYEWGNNSGQSSSSFILGRTTSSADGEGEGDDRMAPLRLDLGPRTFSGLGARRHPLNLRR